MATAVACEEPKEIGLKPSVPLGVLYTDTLTITRTTILLDSVRSNDQSTAMVGRYTDPLFGQVETKAFIQLRPTQGLIVQDSGTTNVTPADRIIVDSTKVRFPLNGIWYGDTTVAQEIILSRLTDSLRTINYDITSPGPAVGQVIARRTVRPRPNVVDTLGFISPIRVDNSLGREIMALANTSALRFSDVTRTLVDPVAFRKQVSRDFVISSTSSPRAAVLGLTPSDGSVITYFHVKGERTAQAYAIPFVGKRYNQVVANRAGTPLASLRPGQSQATTITGRTYVQPGTGVTTKLQFPSLTNLLKTGRVAINRADLVITPIASEDTKLPLPPFLALTEIDAQNRLTRATVTPGVASLLFTVQLLGPLARTPGDFAGTQVAVRDPRTNSYTFQVSGYLQSVASGISPNAGLALLTPSSRQLFAQNPQTGAFLDQTQAVLSDRVWRMVLEGKASVKLVLFYTKSS